MELVRYIHLNPLRVKLVLEKLFKRTVDYYQINAGDLKTKSKVPMISTARAVLCYLAVRRLNISCVDVARELNITPSAVSKL